MQLHISVLECRVMCPELKILKDKTTEIILMKKEIFPVRKIRLPYNVDFLTPQS